MSIALATFSAPLLMASAMAIAERPSLRMPRFPRFSVRKVGGLTFVRVGKLSLSFCITNKG